MSWTELRFRLQHDCPFNDFGRKHPSIPFDVWCNGTTDFLQIQSDFRTFQDVQRDLMALARAKGAKILSKFSEAGGYQILVKTCACNKGRRVSISSLIQGNNLLELQPVFNYGGWEHYRAIAFRDIDVKKFFKRLDQHARTEILARRRLDNSAMRDNYLVSMGTFFNQLTGRQADALLTALESGYYQVPKKVTTEEIARKRRVPRTTYEEHLRKAEAKVLRSLAPYFSQYARSKAYNRSAQMAYTAQSRSIHEPWEATTSSLRSSPDQVPLR